MKANESFGRDNDRKAQMRAVMALVQPLLPAATPEAVEEAMKRLMEMAKAITKGVSSVLLTPDGLIQRLYVHLHKDGVGEVLRRMPMRQWLMYCRRCMVRIMLDEKRKAERQKVLRMKYSEAFGMSAGMTRMTIEDMVMELGKVLSEKDLKLVRMRFVQNMDAKEMAIELQKHESTIYRWLKDIFQKLRSRKEVLEEVLR